MTTILLVIAVCIIAMPLLYALDKAEAQRPLSLEEAITLLDVPRFKEGDPITFENKRGRERIGRFIGYCFKKQHLRIMVKMPEGNTLRRRPEHIRVLRAA